jgi:hypothetical protein
MPAPHHVVSRATGLFAAPPSWIACGASQLSVIVRATVPQGGTVCGVLLLASPEPLTQLYGHRWLGAYLQLMSSVLAEGSMQRLLNVAEKLQVIAGPAARLPLRDVQRGMALQELETELTGVGGTSSAA